MDITYIPMARGFVYLAVVLDWFSRRVLSWRVSITMEAAFCVETLEDALARHGKPEIFNTDQGSQFTGAAFTGVLIKNGIAISMDGKGAWRDNVFVERLWRSIKYEEVYLRAYDSVSEARASIGRYLTFYNGRRPHASLDGRHPIKPTSPAASPLGSQKSADEQRGSCSGDLPCHAPCCQEISDLRRRSRKSRQDKRSPQQHPSCSVPNCIGKRSVEQFNRRRPIVPVVWPEGSE